MMKSMHGVFLDSVSLCVNCIQSVVTEMIMFFVKKFIDCGLWEKELSFLVSHNEHLNSKFLYHQDEVQHHVGLGLKDTLGLAAEIKFLCEVGRGSTRHTLNSVNWTWISELRVCVSIESTYM